MSIRQFAPLAAVSIALSVGAISAINPTSARADSDCATSYCGSGYYDTGRLGVGGAVGHEFQVDQRDGDQVSLVAQYRLTHRASVELEMGRTEYDDGNDVDKRLGGGLSLQIGRLAFLTPYILGAGGIYGNSDNPYLEAGAGVKFPITRHIVLMLDVRSGHRWGDEGSSFEPVPLAAGASSSGSAPRGEFDYSRWRLIGMVFF